LPIQGVQTTLAAVPPLSTVYFRFDKDLPDEAAERIDTAKSEKKPVRKRKTAGKESAAETAAKKPRTKKKTVDAESAEEVKTDKPKRAGRTKKLA
jgi:hypothetical protein